MTTANGSRAAQFTAPQGVEHTFTTGRSALLRDQLPKMLLIRSGLLSDDMLAAFDEAARGELADAKKAVELSDLLVQVMWLDPTIGTGPDDVPIERLTDEEIQETLAVAFGGARDLEAFRGDDPRAASSASGEDVGGDAEPDSRDATGEPRSVDRRPRPRAATRGRN